MPTRPDPNSPFLPARAEAVVDSTPGMPALAGKPSPQAADLSFPAPPAPASAPPGRPSTPPVPAPTAGPTTAQPPQPAKPAQPVQPQQPLGPGVVGASASPPQPAQIPPGGLGISTPLGVARRDERGEPRLDLSPEGDLRYREGIIRTRERLGPIPRVLRHPSLPQLPIQLGRWNYNPFTGQFQKG